MYLHGKYRLYESYINNNREHKKTEFLGFHISTRLLRRSSVFQTSRASFW